ncbi:mobilization protein [Streptomyces sp. CB02923]|uniref:relaxase/mobilization nuclease domain-containing protein n=1 Tax=Streptomyces sp. CB02923 TaxID=1718985 RepID=UPI00093FF1BF|nr:relaxase/mobilization nuclease domain-containing protein [Streptomyces sp. CB02923]OKI00913.1 mobilization protein [Streptomyces sp. CB02923]
MIPRLQKRGSRTIGLLRYLYGPGTHEEHIAPHLVAAFDPLTPDPGRDPHATFQQLQRLLDQPVDALPTSRRPEKHVWHLSVRAAPEDPVLADEDWGAIARRMVAATGLAPKGDEQACRWAAVRHADDHIHIIATLVRDDGRRPRLNNEAKRAQQEARRIEADYGLRRVGTGDGTAARRPTSAERHKAQRRGQVATSRELLREAARTARAGAATEQEFFDRLAAEGVRIKLRTAPSGDVTGYSLAHIGDRNADQEPIWYSGSKLAPDLSLPKIRERLAQANPDSMTKPEHSATARAAPSAPARARRSATAVVWEAAHHLDDVGDGAAAAQIAAAGEVLDTLVKTSSPSTRIGLREAARRFERASRSHVRAQHQHSRALRKAARELVYGGSALGSGEDGAATAMVLDSLVFLAIAIARWHTQRHHEQQALAARQAAQHLRAAYRTSAATPLALLREQGQHLPRGIHARHAATVQATLPRLADTILAEPGWNALAATLTQAHQAGRDPRHLLAEAAAYREVDSADSVSDVLVWRLRHLADLPADARPLPDRARQPSGTVPSPTPRSLPQAGRGRRHGR